MAATESAYRAMSRTHPETHFIYGEIGFPWGGAFYPHRTHRTGLSFDFLVPLKDGKSIPTRLTNRFGYDAEFDDNGDAAFGSIDFAALAGHLHALKAAATERGGRIVRVILAPDLQDELFATAGGAALRNALRFNRRQAWVRHDDHYHVDFSFPCER